MKRGQSKSDLHFVASDKRGQVTIFIILAIVIVVVAGVIFLFKGSIAVGQDSNLDVLSIAEVCVARAAYDAVMFNSMQGGYFLTPSPNFVVDDIFTVPVYLEGSDFSNIPTEEVLKEQMEDAIFFAISFYCVEDINSYEGFNTSGINSVDVRFSQDAIDVEVDFPVYSTSLKDGTVESYDGFSTDIPFDYLGYYNTAVDAANIQKENPGVLSLTDFTDFAEERDLEYNLIPVANESYVLHNLIFNLDGSPFEEGLIYSWNFIVKLEESVQ